MLNPAKKGCIDRLRPDIFNNWEKPAILKPRYDRESTNIKISKFKNDRIIICAAEAFFNASRFRDTNAANIPVSKRGIAIFIAGIGINELKAAAADPAIIRITDKIMFFSCNLCI